MRAAEHDVRQHQRIGRGHREQEWIARARRPQHGCAVDDHRRNRLIVLTRGDAGQHVEAVAGLHVAQQPLRSADRHTDRDLVAGEPTRERIGGGLLCRGYCRERERTRAHDAYADQGPTGMHVLRPPRRER